MLELDHVVLAVHDLDAAAAANERERGLRSYAGGRHPGLGTANRIVPLGSAYLELMAVVEPDARGAWARLVRAAATETGRPVLWCVRSDDLDAVARRLGLAVAEHRRELPDGGTLTWRLAGVEAAVAEPALPFFIQWDDAERHPAAVGIAHPAARGEPLPQRIPRGAPEEPRRRPGGAPEVGVRVAAVEVAGDARRLETWLGGAELPVRVVAGGDGVRAVRLAAPGGEIAIP